MNSAIIVSIVAFSFFLTLILMLGLAMRLRRAETEIARLKAWRVRQSADESDEGSHNRFQSNRYAMHR